MRTRIVTAVVVALGVVGVAGPVLSAFGGHHAVQSVEAGRSFKLVK